MSNTLNQFVGKFGIKFSEHRVTKNIRKLVDSYSSDFIHSVSKREVLAPKHFLLGISLHNMTGQKKVFKSQTD